jgi:hypothetical protein
VEKTAAKNRKIIALYVVITIALTWLLQFMPMIMGLDIENTSISSFDFACDLTSVQDIVFSQLISINQPILFR